MSASFQAKTPMSNAETSDLSEFANSTIGRVARVNRPSRATLAILASVALACSVCPPASADDQLASAVEPLMENFMAARTNGTAVVVPGMSLAIGRDGKLIYSAGYGFARTGEAASARTVYAVGSITKQFTAAAVLRLMERGAVSQKTGQPLAITLPVDAVLDVASGWTIEGGPPITVGHLLSMTSNLPNFTRRPPKPLDPWGAVPARRLLGTMKYYRPSGFPGSFEYSNTSYFLLSALMEAVNVNGMARDYHRILRDEIFSPLGLADTGFVTDSGVASRIAAPHYHRNLTFAKPDWLKGCGDVASSVIDIFNWDAALLDGRVLEPRMRDVMFSDAARVDPYTYYGAGWFINHRNGTDRYFHSGTVSGYTAFNLIVRTPPEHWLSVSLLANADGITAIDDLADAIAATAERVTN